MYDTNIQTVSFLYKILKINGLAPFSYNFKRQIVYSSAICTIRSVCTCIFVIGISIFCNIQLTKGYVPYQGKAIEYVVSHVLFYYNLIKITINIYIQFVHRDELIRLLNQILSTKSNFEHFAQSDRFHDYKLSKHLSNGKILACIRFVILICSITCYMYRTLYLNSVLLIFCYVTVICMNLYSILITGIYYNGLMIFVDHCYRILINRLKFLLMVVKKKVNPLTVNHIIYSEHKSKQPFETAKHQVSLLWLKCTKSVVYLSHTKPENPVTIFFELTTTHFT